RRSLLSPVSRFCSPPSRLSTQSWVSLPSLCSIASTERRLTVPELTAAFLLVALAAYVLFGGAGFGAGVLEATLTTPPLKKKLQAIIAPVWEANHVWLIAVVVILFVGFPRFYTTALTRLYVPISLALLSILVRGTFFTLRKYDPDPGAFRKMYTALFRLSSF